MTGKKKEPQAWQKAQWTYESPLGPMCMLGHEGALTDLYFLGEAHEPQGLEAIPRIDLPVFSQTKDWLDAYFSGQPMDQREKPSYELHGSSFQKGVWSYIERIPYGQSMTYGQIAKQVAQDFGKKAMSAQAVGGATGRNPISLIVPCHRVLGAHQAITGYGGGLDRKRFLLNLEKISYKDLMK